MSDRRKNRMIKRELYSRRDSTEDETNKPEQGEMDTIASYMRFSDEFSVRDALISYGAYGNGGYRIHPNVDEVYRKDVILPSGQIIKITAVGQHQNINLILTNTSATPLQITKLWLPNYNDDIGTVTLKPDRPVSYLLLNQHLQNQAGKVKYMLDLEIEGSSEYGNFIDDFSKMQINEDLADAILICDGVNISCHVAILAARSKHFKEMFVQQSFVEGKTKRVAIKDMPLATLKEMIKFVYSNRFDEKNTDISALFSAAHLYTIPDLVSKCESIMTQTLTIENAAEFFFKGFLTESDRLKMASMDFISKNFAEVKSTEGWKSLMKDGNSSLALEEILSFATSNK